MRCRSNSFANISFSSEDSVRYDLVTKLRRRYEKVTLKALIIRVIEKNRPNDSKFMIRRFQMLVNRFDAKLIRNIRSNRLTSFHLTISQIDQGTLEIVKVSMINRKLRINS